MNFINFNEHILETKRNKYGGSEKKRTIILDDNQQYLLKFPDPTREIKRDISYINNAISEYIGCKIFKQVGIRVQDTILGVFTDEKGREKVACACRDLCEANGVLYEAETLALELLDDKQNLTFDYVKTLLGSLEGIDKVSTFHEYCNRFIIDALIGNTDRHNGNWGFIEDECGFGMAPVYDCGSSFSPLFSDSELTEKLASNEALNVLAAIVDENGRRLNYRDYLISGRNADVNLALAEIVPKIDLTAIYGMIDEIPYIADVRKKFYKELVDIRYRKILIPALESVLGISKSFEYKQWNSRIIDYIYSNYILAFQSADKVGVISYQTDTSRTLDFRYKKNNDIVFFLNDDDRCIGMAMLEKSNLNVCKFVQSAREMKIVIDIDFIRKEQSYQEAQSDETSKSDSPVVGDIKVF